MLLRLRAAYFPRPLPASSLVRNGFPGDDIPIVRGSALAALESAAKDIDAPEYQPILKLMNAVDSYIPTPERKVDQPFLMPVEDVFAIKGRGTVVTRRIERGKVKIGDTYVRTTDVTGNIQLPAGMEMVMPGDNVAMEVELIVPVAIEAGLRFAIREGGRTVGSGVVTSIVE